MARGFSLPPEALDTLLARLHPDRDHAAADYEALRARLIRFFEWKHSEAPDRLADETLDRVALRLLGEGEPIEKIGAFAHGVAANLCREQSQQPAQVSIETIIPPQLPVEDPRQIDKDAAAEGLRLRRLERQRRCLELLAPEDRNLITEYHRGRGRERMQARRALAIRIGIGMNALRIRVHRIRCWLMDCAGSPESSSAVAS
jgi:hypothetical protein